MYQALSKWQNVYKFAIHIIQKLDPTLKAGFKPKAFCLAYNFCFHSQNLQDK